MNNFLEIAPSVSMEELDASIERLNIKLPQSFKEHYVTFNGGYTFRRFFMWPDESRTRIDHFFLILHKKFTSLEEAYEDLFVSENILPKGFLPFAVDDGANFFCLCLLPEDYNSVFYAAMYNYNPENSSDYLTKISPSFEDFIDELVT